MDKVDAKEHQRFTFHSTCSEFTSLSSSWWDKEDVHIQCIQENIDNVTVRYGHWGVEMFKFVVLSQESLSFRTLIWVPQT